MRVLWDKEETKASTSDDSCNLWRMVQRTHWEGDIDNQVGVCMVLSKNSGKAGTAESKWTKTNYRKKNF